jgi:hypothetical protein
MFTPTPSDLLGLGTTLGVLAIFATVVFVAKKFIFKAGH